MQADVREPAQAKVTPTAGDGLINAMTVDVEDYFQVQAFFDHIDRADWDGMESRVERNVDRVLALFDEAGVKGTFFTLGWVAERYPHLIRRIVAEGHELASHGMAHFRADSQSPAVFREDVSRAKKLLEDAGGARVNGYRAASFSIGTRNLWAFEVLAEAGYTYSSSVYPIRHDIYGMPEAPRFAFKPEEGAGRIVELPVTTNVVFGRKVPCGGGGWFRLLPYAWSTWHMRRVNQRDGKPCMFYFHPWEIDPGQPVQRQASLKSRLRHYTNLERMEGKLARLLRDFRWGRMDQAFAADLA